MDDPIKKAKEKAAASYNAAADHFDDEPLSFWDLIGKHTVTNLKLPAGAKFLMLVAERELSRCLPHKRSARTDLWWELT